MKYSRSDSDILLLGIVNYCLPRNLVKKQKAWTSCFATRPQCVSGASLPAACSAPRSSWRRRPTAPGSCPPTRSCWRTGTESPWCSERRWTWAGPTPGSLPAAGCSGGPSRCARSSCGRASVAPLALAKVKHLPWRQFAPLDGLRCCKTSRYQVVQIQSRSQICFGPRSSFSV